ncbi:MAG: hypothetical protein PHX38_05870 [Sulfuricella sp.]|nr:hypothetical protein [Sulfuricella sp.]
MPNISLKNISDSLYRRLKDSAVQHHRSLNKEMIARLEAQLGSPHLDVEQKLAEIRILRQRVPLYANPEEIDAFRQEGRP